MVVKATFTNPMLSAPPGVKSTMRKNLVELFAKYLRSCLAGCWQMSMQIQEEVLLMQIISIWFTDWELDSMDFLTF